MYCDYFGFIKDPFGFKFDLDFLYQSESWASVYEQLSSEIQASRKVLLLTGECGVGKSHLLKVLESRLESKVQIVHQQVNWIDYEGFFENICIQLLLNTENKDLSQKIQLLKDYLSAQHKSHLLLIIDDAHLLSDPLLEKIKPILVTLIRQPISFQILLTGQPALKENYSRLVAGNNNPPAVARYALEPLQEIESATYIRRRLQSVGDDVDSTLFPQSTLDIVWQFTHGVPGSINNLCTAALKSALNTGQKTITSELIQRIGEIGFDWHPERMTDSASTVPVVRIDLTQPDNQKARVPQENLRQKTLGDFLNTKIARYSAASLGVFLLFNFFILSTDTERNSGNELNLAGNAQTNQQPGKRDQADFGLAEFYLEHLTTPKSQTPDPTPKEAKTNGPHFQPTFQSAIGTPKPIIVKPIAIQDFTMAGESARLYIQKQETNGLVVNLGEIYKEAQLMGRQNRSSDAYLLYFYAARLGHPDAAFKLGQMNDPATFRQKLNIVGSPDPMQAYKWYQKAANTGHVKANLALTRLHTNITKQASAGDRIAERWLLQWK